MQYMKIMLPALALLILSACVTPEERSRPGRRPASAVDGAKCTELGFKKDTEGFSTCLLKLQEIRAQEENTRALNRAATPPPFWPYGRPGYWY